MRYGFLIDQRRCIGCHACTVACKAENSVPLGSFRTWVKYTEKGSFPHVNRSFLVERCNHCDDAPCVAICPVEALWRRQDGIVDFSTDRCIGCKACMAACPYDAIYIDPNTHTLGKCNYCAHRVDLGLQPACVNVCPVEAIITGDLDDPASRISQLLSLEPAVVRRPEKGTRPKLFYLGADEAAVNPEAASEQQSYMMAQADPSKPIRITDSIGYVPSGMVQRDYSVAHARPWGWQVAAYLWTKAVAAGAFLVAAVVLILGGVGKADLLLTEGAPVVCLLFLGLTNLFLVMDLERPERFLRVVLRPHWTSWLVIGAYILALFGGVITVALAVRLVAGPDLFRALLWPGAVLAVAVAAYSAFLLAQAKGRDLWQSPLLAPHLVVQAVVAGAAALVLLAAVVDRGSVHPLAATLSVGVALSALLILSEISLPHPTAHARQAVRALIRGQAAAPFWLGAMAVGSALPFLLAVWAARGGPAVVAAIAAVSALAGLAVYEHLYVRAGQSVPLS